MQEQCFVYADSNQISQVLRNLIDNAIKYSNRILCLRKKDYFFGTTKEFEESEFGKDVES